MLARRQPVFRHAARLTMILGMLAGLAACGGRSPDAGDAVAVRGASSGGEVDAAARDAADAETTETPPLGPELAEIFRLIEGYRTGPARVRLVKYRKLNPDDGAAAFLFGLTYHREKRYRKAVEHFEKAIELAPGYPPTYHFMGWARLYLGEVDAARAAFETHLQRQPDVADSHFALGLLDLEHDDLDAARLRFQTAVDLQHGRPGTKPRDLAKAYAQLGEVSARRNELEEARRLLERAVALYPDHYEAYYRLYRVLVRLGDDEAAARALENHDAAKQRVRPGTSFPE